MNRFRSLVLAALTCAPYVADAQQHDTTQHPMPGMQMPAPRRQASADTAQRPMPDSMQMRMGVMNHMTMMNGPLGISMERMGSGTTWIPDDVRLPSRHFMSRGWEVMLHGFLFGQYDRQGGPRGGDQVGSLNWAMVMASHPLAGGSLQLRFMPSLDAATVGKCGYPLLLQSGESCHGAPLVDRQHPHDFFMELGALYERELTSRVAFLLYAAPAGEPALGPVAFMHRPSAMDNAFAPIGHHWQDATHISFGVVTSGLYTRHVRLEASAFNGHEPDENRWDFDPILLNSYSARLTVNPDAHWSFTAGYGDITQPEPGAASVHRVVASASHGRAIGADGQWATTLVYGANRDSAWSISALLESEAVLDRHNTIFGRAELVQKTAEDLGVTGFPSGHRFGVGAVTIGYIRELLRGHDVTVGAGASGTLNVVPESLRSAYGSRTPAGALLFVRLRPYHSAHMQ